MVAFADSQKTGIPDFRFHRDLELHAATSFFRTPRKLGLSTSRARGWRTKHGGTMASRNKPLSLSLSLGLEGEASETNSPAHRQSTDTSQPSPTRDKELHRNDELRAADHEAHNHDLPACVGVGRSFLPLRWCLCPAVWSVSPERRSLPVGGWRPGISLVLRAVSLAAERAARAACSVCSPMSHLPTDLR